MPNAAKTGRPPKPDNARSDRVAFRLTVAELAVLQDAAARAGVSVSAYCRAAALGLRVRAAAPRADQAALTDLNRVGVNLNQIARQLNARGFVPVDLDAVLSEVRSIIERIASR